MNPILLGTFLAALALVLLLASSTRRRSQRDLRVRIFEIVAAAARRGVPIAPAIRRMAESERGGNRESMTNFAIRLDSGESVGAALAAAMPAGIVPRDVLAAVRATEGTSAQRATLESLAGSGDQMQDSRDQLSMALAYPALLAVSLVGVHATTGSLFDTFATAGPGLAGGMSAIVVHLVALVLWTILGFAIVGNVSTVRGRVSQFFARLALHLPILGRIVHVAASARILRAAASLAAAGLPLGELLRRSARATAIVDLRRSVADAGDLADQGASSDQVWHSTGLPDFAIALAELASGADPHEVGRRLRAAASACDRRVDRSVHRSLAILQPTLIAFFGALIAAQFAMVFDKLQTLHWGNAGW